MCGIVGIWDTRTRDISEQLISRLTDSLAHRGPDDGGMWVNALDGVAFGHRRLAILDLSSRGKQPMSNDDGSLWITYNGEIYNFNEIKHVLVRRGYTFKSTSDTEVILKAYQEWGIESFTRLRGMFAFALWDARRRELVLVRDRLGVKPLFYSVVQGLVLFGSELKALMAHPRFAKQLDRAAVMSYLQLGFVPSPASIFANTHKVKPGCYVRITADGRADECRYWNLDDFIPATPTPINRADAERELTRLLVESFKYRMVSDVPVGVFLSGGIDSSLVTAILTREAGERLHTFVVAFDDPAWDESSAAAAVARHLGTEHTTLGCSALDALDIVPRLADIYDEPCSDSAAIPMFQLSREVRKHVKVVLSGDGGDELFCGYNTYTKFGRLWQNMTRIPFWLRQLLSGAVRVLSLDQLDAMTVGAFHRLFPDINISDYRDKLERFPSLFPMREFMSAYGEFASRWSPRELVRLAPAIPFQPLFHEMDGITRDLWTTMMRIDVLTFLPDNYLVKTDRASMAVGLEVREPMLDHKLVEFAFGLPIEFKYSQGITKRILRDILRRYLPDELVDRSKHGFSVPLGDWLRGPLRDLALDYLSFDRIHRQGLFDPVFVQETVTQFFSGARTSPKKIWSLVVFQAWYEQWLRN